MPPSLRGEIPFFGKCARNVGPRPVLISKFRTVMPLYSMKARSLSFTVSFIAILLYPGVTDNDGNTKNV